LLRVIQQCMMQRQTRKNAIHAIYDAEAVIYRYKQGKIRGTTTTMRDSKITSPQRTCSVQRSACKITASTKSSMISLSALMHPLKLRLPRPNKSPKINIWLCVFWLIVTDTNTEGYHGVLKMSILAERISTRKHLPLPMTIW